MFVYTENVPRRHMNQRQKVAAFHCMNAWLPPKEQLTDAEIQARVGLKSGILVSQIGRIAKKNPDMARMVASGEVSAPQAIRMVLKEEPADDREQTALMAQAPEIIFILRNKKLITNAHGARLQTGMTKQQMFNKAVELYIDWAAKEVKEMDAISASV